MACLIDCWELSELGPPPNTIEFLPPPPLPAFLQRASASLPSIETFHHLIGGGGNNASSPCVEQLCDRWLLGAIGGAINDGTSSITHTRGSSIGGGLGNIGDDDSNIITSSSGREWNGSSSTSVDDDSDTWLLILIGCSVGVLLLGAVLALFLLRCREVLILAHRQHQSKASISHHHHNQHNHHRIEQCSNLPTGQIKIPRHGADTVLYPINSLQHSNNMTTVRHQDNRLLWAALTPRGGTQHFISENYPHTDYGLGGENDNTYETIENYLPPPVVPVIQFNKNKLKTEKSSFDNSGFVDYDYEDPTPLIESYQLNDIENHDTNPYAEVEIANLHQINNTLRRVSQIRPCISSPTRIENPNLPPLNLHPGNGGNNYVIGIHRNNITTNATLRRGTLSRRSSDASNHYNK